MANFQQITAETLKTNPALFTLLSSVSIKPNGRGHGAFVCCRRPNNPGLFKKFGRVFQSAGMVIPHHQYMELDTLVFNFEQKLWECEEKYSDQLWPLMKQMIDDPNFEWEIRGHAKENETIEIIMQEQLSMCSHWMVGKNIYTWEEESIKDFIEFYASHRA